MSEFISDASRLFWGTYHDSWTVINSLDRHQWLTALVVTTALGFLCMRGYGSRNSY